MQRSQLAFHLVQWKGNQGSKDVDLKAKLKDIKKHPPQNKFRIIKNNFQIMFEHRKKFKFFNPPPQ